jgi:hypothetical protein
MQAARAAASIQATDVMDCRARRRRAAAAGCCCGAGAAADEPEGLLRCFRSRSGAVRSRSGAITIMMTSSGSAQVPTLWLWLVAMACAASTRSVSSVDAASASRSAEASLSRSELRSSVGSDAPTPPRNASSLGAACPSGYAIRGACVPIGTSPLQYYVDLVSAAV